MLLPSPCFNHELAQFLSSVRTKEYYPQDIPRLFPTTGKRATAKKDPHAGFDNFDRL